MHQFNKILIIQTAFIGDVILATSVVEKLHQCFPQSKLDFLLRKGNERLLAGHPHIREVLIWDKRSKKLANLHSMVRKVRKNKYDLVINLQRFLSSGILAGFSGASKIVGFSKNPLSFLFSETVAHKIGDGTHEIERNQQLIASFTDNKPVRPRLHLSDHVLESVSAYKKGPYITIAPTSVWFTKQFPAEKWIEFINKTSFGGKIYLMGGPDDHEACERIKNDTKNELVVNLCGKLDLMGSAALMKDAKMNFVNDSAPQHLASAVNAPTCSVFCSTIPDFGFGPLSDRHTIIETNVVLSCRPCGLHGYRSCPEGHFKCALTIETSALESVL